ncbi:MAG: DUF362 domain-containing protein, partial [Oligoflexales bacterium]|nr:DUF362 domain-containing protein [Oligoflexales bacterium]
MKKRVSILNCSSYDHPLVRETVLQCINHLGGIEKFVSRGERILVKPNLLMRREPGQVTTTHPAIVLSVCEILKEAGCSIIIADSPGGPYNEARLRSVYRTTGMEEVAEKVGAKLNFDTSSVEVETKEGCLLKRLTLLAPFREVDKVISISKLKSHALTQFTGGVKNLFGMIPGIQKMEYHLKMADTSAFCNVLVDTCVTVNPVLSVMDAVEAMDGQGPASGRKKHVGAVIASSSPYHLDAVA